MEGCPNSFLYHADVAFRLGYVLLWICKIHTNVELVCHRILEILVLVVADDLCDRKVRCLVEAKDLS